MQLDVPIRLKDTSVVLFLRQRDLGCNSGVRHVHIQIEFKICGRRWHLMRFSINIWRYFKTLVNFHSLPHSHWYIVTYRMSDIDLHLCIRALFHLQWPRQYWLQQGLPLHHDLDEVHPR